MTAGRVAVSAITLDFGNTLVRVDRPGLRAVIEETVDALERLAIVADRGGFLTAWAEERDRQFREEVPLFREVEIPPRAIRVLARLRGMAPPPPDARWDDAAAAELADPSEVAAVVEAYSRAFLDRMAPVPDARSTLEQLSGRGFALAILSNWPLASTIDRFAEAQGWLPFLRAIVVSQRVGTIKPHPAIFRAAEEALGLHPRRGRRRGARSGDPPRRRRLGSGRRRGERGRLANRLRSRPTARHAAADIAARCGRPRRGTPARR